MGNEIEPMSVEEIKHCVNWGPEFIKVGGIEEIHGLEVMRLVLAWAHAEAGRRYHEQPAKGFTGGGSRTVDELLAKVLKEIGWKNGQ